MNKRQDLLMLLLTQDGGCLRPPYTLANLTTKWQIQQLSTKKSLTVDVTNDDVIELVKKQKLFKDVNFSVYRLQQHLYPVKRVS